MNEMYKPETGTTISGVERVMTLEDVRRLSRQKLAFVFSSYATGTERVDNLIEANREAIAGLENAEEILVQLRTLEGVQDRAEFIDTAARILEPVIDAGFALKQEEFRSNPEEQVYVANDLLKYTLRSDRATIHVFASEGDFGLRQYMEGLSILAEVIQNHPEILFVEAKSWIILQHPRILEALGFTIDRDGKDNPIIEIAEDGDRRGRATMLKDDFLNKYLKK